MVTGNQPAEPSPPPSAPSLAGDQAGPGRQADRTEKEAEAPAPPLARTAGLSNAIPTSFALDGGAEDDEAEKALTHKASEVLRDLLRDGGQSDPLH
jgi:hypothetical protein